MAGYKNSFLSANNKEEALPLAMFKKMGSFRPDEYT
jgi:hypothetical protein